MKFSSSKPEITNEATASPNSRARLFRKYVVFFVTVVSVALLVSSLSEIWFSYQEQKTLLVSIQRGQGEAVAAKISQFVREIERQIGWTTQLPWADDDIENRRYDLVRLLRQMPAIAQIAEIDGRGREQIQLSRFTTDVVGSQVDFSGNPKFTEAIEKKIYYGPVYFRRDSEPYMTLSMVHAQADAGVTVAEINLKFIWELLSQTETDQHRQAYVVDSGGRLIAHNDINLVLRNSDLSGLPQVRAGLAGRQEEQVQDAKDIGGREVLTAHAPVSSLGWTVFVDVPIEEAYAPLYASIARSSVSLIAVLAFALLVGLFLARRIVVPMRLPRGGDANR